MFGTCSTEGCDKPGFTMTQRCPFHEALANARQLSTEDFESFKTVLANTAPLTSEERSERRARSALRSMQWMSRDLKKYKAQARENGATESQIEDAIRAGRKEA